MEKTIGIFDLTTGEQIVREMNSDELAVYEISVLDNEKKKEEAAEKIAAKEAAQAKLAALGLTTDDLKALGL